MVLWSSHVLPAEVCCSAAPPVLPVNGFSAAFKYSKLADEWAGGMQLNEGSSILFVHIVHEPNVTRFLAGSRTDYF